MSNKFFLNIFFILQIGIGFPVVIYIYTFVIPYPLPDKNSKELFIVDRFKKYELLQDNYSNLGKINKNTIIYQKTDTTFFLLAWIWAESINISDWDSSFVCLVDENLRICSNNTIIANVLQGNKGNMIYLNNNKSWALVEFMLDTTNLKVKECFVKTSMQVITNSSGGEYNDNSAESEFIMRCMRQPLWTISLFLLVYILPLTIAALIKKVFNRKSKNKNIGDNFH